jgi:hypothetical protein
VSIETVNAIASIATLLVIAATAVAALGQVRHMRSSNQIVALTECREVLESDAFADAVLFVRRKMPELLKDPEVVARLRHPPFDAELRPITVVGNFYESMGSFVKHDIIDAEIACDLWCGNVVNAWNAIVPALSIFRSSFGGPALWENFEYLAALSMKWIESHPAGNYPKSAPRLPVPAPPTAD